MRRAPSCFLVAVALISLAGCSSAAAPATSTGATEPAGGSTASEGTPSAVPASIASVVTPGPTLLIVSPIPDAPASGFTAKIAAKSLQWSTSTLAAPAGKLWSVQINDQDNDSADSFLRHNFVIETGPAVTQRIFVSPKFGFGIHTFGLPALPAGTYTFLCTIHPDSMTGTLTVG